MNYSLEQLKLKYNFPKMLDQTFREMNVIIEPCCNSLKVVPTEIRTFINNYQQ